MRDEGVGARGWVKILARQAFRLRSQPFGVPSSPCPSEAAAGPTFSMRPAFSAELSSSLCSLSLSRCSLAFSLSKVSIWARWAPLEVAKEAWVLAGPSTPGGLREPRGPWPRAAGCGCRGCSRGCCRYWYCCCCCWRNTGGTWACRILGDRRSGAQRPHRLTQSSPELAQPSWAYWKDKSTQPPRMLWGGLFYMLSAEDPQGSRE